MPQAIDRRHFLAAVPALLATPRLLAQSATPPIRVTGLSQLTLTVSDPQRSLAFYQGLFGMPVQARQGTTTYLRIGAGPRYLAIVPAGPNERPSISRFGLGVERFDADEVLRILAQHGVTPSDDAASTAAVAPMKVRSTMRGNTREIVVGDPSGIVFQLQDVSYCGGSGPLGNMCQVQPSAVKGLIALRDMSHFTINAPSPRTVGFYQELFGMPVRAMQGAAPAYGVGPGVHFLMFIGGGGARGGGAAAAPPGAPTGANPPAAPGDGNAAAAPGGGRGGAVDGGRGGAPTAGRIDHACMSVETFDVDAILKTLAGYGIKASETTGRSGGPMTSWVSVRPEARGGAPVTGTPELYFSDPDGLNIQLQDVKYCGGGGYLGNVCLS
jgi:catechol 2,3-dioxygenase-like lactoylglutathione lyase family enzyme